MTQTPGQYLAAELERLGMTKTDLAQRLRVQYATVLRWTQNNGFSRGNRTKAALAMGLQPDHFERPDISQQHDELCRKALDKFLASPVAADISDAEKASIAAFKPPLDKAPNEVFYVSALMLVRNQAPWEAVARELAENEELAASVARKLERAAKSKASDLNKGKRVPPKKDKRARWKAQ